jgi:hypothetical protein
MDPGGVGDAAKHAALGIFQLSFAQLWLCEDRWLASSQDEEECQIGIAGYVIHLAGHVAHAQIMFGRGVENVRRGDARISASSGNDGTDHSAGAARNELVTGLDHMISTL